MTEPIRVLYVDDDVHGLRLRQELLEEHGDLELITESSTDAALSRLETDPDIDCLLSDLEMAETDGLEFLGKVRDRYPRLPFIMFSAAEDEEAVEEAIRNGATDYIPKSTAALSYGLVANRIKQAVELSSSPDRPGPQNEAPDADRSSIAAAIEDAASDTTREAERESPRRAGSDTDSSQPEHCPVPGCSFEGGGIGDIASHCRTVGTRDDLDGRLHRRLNPIAPEEGGEWPVEDDSEKGVNHEDDPDATVRTLPEGIDPEDLDGLPDDALYTIARMLDIQGRSRMHRQELLRAIREAIGAPVSARHGAGTTNGREGGGFTEQDIHTLRDVLSRLLQEEPAESIPPAESQQPAAATAATASAASEAPTSTTEERAGLPGEQSSDEPLVFDFSLEADDAVEPTTPDPDHAEEEDDEQPTSEPEPTAEDEGPDVEPGDAVLLRTPTHDERRESICDRYLGVDEAAEQRILLIQYRRIDPEQLERLALAAEDLSLISVGHDPTIPSSIEGFVNVVTIDKPSDFRRLGIVITRIVEEWKDDPYQIRVCFDSLNVVLRYADIQRVFRFLHVLIGKLASFDAISHFHLDPASENGRDVTMMETLFDQVTDTR